MNTPLQDIKNYTLDELEHFLASHNFPKYSAQQIFNWLYKKRVEDFSLMTNLSKKLRTFCENNFFFSRLECCEKISSLDGTEKFGFLLKDKNYIESVLIPDKSRYTLCISTQVGCKFRCKFCVSGVNGFRRNLAPSEIIGQYLYINDHIYPQRITNIVFMGIGEPLDNFDNVVKAISILMCNKGVYLGRRKICISTVGIPERIIHLADTGLKVKLSLSLHCADEEKRGRIMPIARKYPLDEIMGALKYYSKRNSYPITFEYILIKNFNTSREDALKLSRLVKRVPHKVNLIPYNENKYFSWQRPDKEEIEQFKNVLKKNSVFFTLRLPRGEDISAACGSLQANFSSKAE